VLSVVVIEIYAIVIVVEEMVLKVLRVFKDLREHKVLKVLLEDHKGILVLKALKDFKEIREHKELKDPQVLDFKVLPESKALQESKVLLELKVPQVLDFKEQQESREAPGFKE
jgi:hypothetical protein